MTRTAGPAPFRNTRCVMPFAVKLNSVKPGGIILVLYFGNKDGRSPIVSWLRELCRKMWAEAGGPGVGVIGLCMTGNFAISLMADEAVLAPVASEPALPLAPWTPSRKGALAVTEVELAGALRRCIADQPIMALRFSGDPISPAERLDAL